MGDTPYDPVTRSTRHRGSREVASIDSFSLSSWLISGHVNPSHFLSAYERVEVETMAGLLHPWGR